MSKQVQALIDSLEKQIEDSLQKVLQAHGIQRDRKHDFAIEIPQAIGHGDFSTNAAMVQAKLLKTSPRKLAEEMLSHLSSNYLEIERIEIAGPGFINFFVSKRFYAKVLQEILERDAEYGKCDYGKGERVIVEYVSANPTGPMHMGNARGGALGDSLASVLDAAGYTVYREFYINDAGNQIEKFAESLNIRYQQIFKSEHEIPLPDDCYHGEDIKDLAEEFSKIHGDSYMSCSDSERRKALVDFSLPRNISKMKKDMETYRIQYDNWFHESILHKDGEVEETVSLLKAKALTYESDGAIWYRATQFGAEKDEVLIRKNGTPTYFAADIAYHRNKLAIRKFDHCIDVWGADHHGHISRTKNALDALGLDGSKLDVVLMQLVKLVQNGQVIRMSKRTGKTIQLSDLLEEVPVDAARFLFNMREANTQMEFDLDLAIKQDAQNPVYYVQYAHARICSIIRILSQEGIVLRNCSIEALCRLDKPEEKDLIRHLSLYTHEIIAAAKEYNPTRITRYVIDLATLFHKFYNACRVKGTEYEQERLCLCTCVKVVIKNILTLFKVQAPETM